MTLLRAVEKAGEFPLPNAAQSAKKRYSELLSKYLAEELADGLRSVGFPDVRPMRGGPGERAFQGGLGPKRLDVSYSDHQHGLLMAVSIKSINAAPFGKNLKNRFADLCTEAITLHMRFPYSVVCALFAFPFAASTDVSAVRNVSTFERARMLLKTIGGRAEYTDPGEKFENVTMLLFQPVIASGAEPPRIQLIDSESALAISEADYLLRLREIYNNRNPHALLGDDEFEG